jgi:glycosyltransferase involved in cell wall biosynthesis
VPVRNAENTIERTIESVLSQDFASFELIVIDGNSADGTLRRLERYRNRISKLVSGPDGGVYDAINKGIEIANGELIAILNSDDYYAHGGVLSLYSVAFCDPSVEIVFGDLEYFPASNPTRTVRRFSSKRFEPGRLRYGWMPPHPTVIVRRATYQRIGGYRIDYKIAADYEFLVRALLVENSKYTRLDTVTVRMQLGGLSTSGLGATYTLNREIIRACRENGVHTSWLRVLPKFPVKLLELVVRS